uniref:Uncharacterized protein n=1 Tax=Oryza sativa subsp. japonica TaxID=39947 RepID=Q6ATJ7_ORYSJ|nr:hypothetical protein LOC_Os03g51890 [Oryza sativa Japonica Group]
MDNLLALSTPRLHFVAALNHPSSFPCGSSPLPSLIQCRRRLTNRPATVRLSPAPSPCPMSPPPLNTVRCGRYTSTPLDIAACPPLSVLSICRRPRLRIFAIRNAMQRMGIAMVSCGQRGEMVAAIVAVSCGQRGRDGSNNGWQHELESPDSCWAHPSICLFYRLACSDLVPSSGLCTQELLARFPLHFSLSSISDDEQPITMEIIYFFYKVLMCYTFLLHFSLSSIGNDEQPTTMEINYLYKLREGKIEEALLATVGRTMLVCIGGTHVLHVRFPLHFSLSSIGDDEQPTTMEINYFYKVGVRALPLGEIDVFQHTKNENW